MKLMLLGAPGVGKGTQAKILVTAHGLPQISTGDMLRSAVERGTELGREAKRFMDAGALVPDEVVIGIVRERLSEADTAGGFILDGFPRTVAQAEALAAFAPLDAVVSIDVPEEQLVSRLTGRRTCRACGAIYHVVSSPPSTDGRCDVCGGELYQRSDDQEASIRERLRQYHDKTAPLESWYRERGLLVSIDGTGRPDEVTVRLEQALEARRGSSEG